MIIRRITKDNQVKIDYLILRFFNDISRTIVDKESKYYIITSFELDKEKSYITIPIYTTPKIRNIV